MQPSPLAEDDDPGDALPAQRERYDRVLRILWPAFVMAGVLEMLVFVVVDPGSLHWWGVAPIEWSRSTVYSVTFLIFWAVISTSAAITQLLAEPPPPDESFGPPR